jgi:hypothetical protein
MKNLLIAIGVFAAVLILAIAILITRLDSLLTKSINTYGPEITGTKILKDYY